jgi:hypothetical protein
LIEGAAAERQAVSWRLETVMKIKVIVRTLLGLIVCVVMGCSEATTPEPEEIVAPELDLESEGVALSHAIGQCESDCRGFIQLLFDGTLRVDLIGELPARLHVATVTEAELTAIRTLTKDPDLIAYLSGAEPNPDECEPHIPEDFRTILFRMNSQTLERNPWCSELARELASELGALEAKYILGE